MFPIIFLDDRDLNAVSLEPVIIRYYTGMFENSKRIYDMNALSNPTKLDSLNQKMF